MSKFNTIRNGSDKHLKLKIKFYLV